MDVLRGVIRLVSLILFHLLIHVWLFNGSYCMKVVVGAIVVIGVVAAALRAASRTPFGSR